jgi:general secretion pathway protein E
MSRLGEILSARGRITAEQAEEAARRGAASGRRIGEVLVAEGTVSSREVLEALSEQWSAPWLESVPEEALDPELVRRLPVEWARRNGMLPIRHNGGISVLTARPDRLSEIESLALLLGEEPRLVLAPESIISACIDRCYVRQTDTPEDAIRRMAPAAEVPATKVGEDLLHLSEGAPVTRFVNLMLLDALGQGASDIHIEPHGDCLRVRYRIDGMLADRSSPPKQMEAALASRLKVMARLDIAESRLPQDGAARVRIGDREVDIRVSTVPVADGERIVLRLLRRESSVLPLEALGMDADTCAVFRRLVGQPQGILLVTGPTGSGKTTTLYAAMRDVDTRRLNVMTIEDPIEYRLQAVSQIQINPRIDLTFARCLRHVLRQDPDVVLVGEMRDLETAEIAVRASLTGHLVLSTLHTNDSVGAVLRLVDIGVEPYLISAALLGILAQRLARRLCPECREPAEWTREGLRAAGLTPPADAPASGRHWRARGCPACLEGYKGRVGLFELLILRDAFAQAVRSGSDLHQLRRLARTQGMGSLAEDGWRKAMSGETSLDELVRVAGRSDLQGDA